MGPQGLVPCSPKAASSGMSMAGGFSGSEEEPASCCCCCCCCRTALSQPSSSSAPRRACACASASAAAAAAWRCATCAEGAACSLGRGGRMRRGRGGMAASSDGGAPDGGGGWSGVAGAKALLTRLGCGGGTGAGSSAGKPASTPSGGGSCGCSSAIGGAGFTGGRAFWKWLASAAGTLGTALGTGLGTALGTALGTRLGAALGAAGSATSLSPCTKSCWSCRMCSSDIPHLSCMSACGISRTAFIEPIPASMNFGRYSERPTLFRRIRTSMWPSSVFSACAAAVSSTASSPTGGRDLLQSIIHPVFLLEPGPSSLAKLSSSKGVSLFLAKLSLSASSREDRPAGFSVAFSPFSLFPPLDSSCLPLLSAGAGADAAPGADCCCCCCGGGGCACGCAPPGCIMPCGCCITPCGCIMPCGCMPGIMPCCCICCIIAGDHIMTSREYCSVPWVAERMRPRTTAVGSLAPMRDPLARTSCWYSSGSVRSRAAACGSTGLCMRNSSTWAFIWGGGMPIITGICGTSA
mmetsp:Transcript_66119/g.193492  ORF Transcript_66119/g.193492 Transcript_66119/m.193492 type:complete len:522 (+) Transcript_66119:1246-2811(+)